MVENVEYCNHGRRAICDCDACDFELAVDWVAKLAADGDLETAGDIALVALDMPGSKWLDANGGPVAGLVRLQTIVAIVTAKGRVI